MHIKQFEDIFDIYGVDVHKWALCQLADNANVNKSIARLLRIPHVGCCNHKMNLELSLMVKEDKILSDTIESVHKTMIQWKRSIIESAMLRNLANLSPVLGNPKRWSGKYLMLDRYLRIRDELKQVAESRGFALHFQRSAVFRQRAERYISYQLRCRNEVVL